MKDAALFCSKLSASKSDIVERLNLKEKDFALCTVHRAENTDDKDRLINIIDALVEIAGEMEVIVPLHPRTRRILDLLNLKRKTENLKLIEPVSYFDMIELLKNTKIVLTDSGGLQKEAFFFRKPCVTLRDETEWVELIDGGFNLLAGAASERVIGGYREMKGRRLHFGGEIYGNGLASGNILEAILSHELL